LTLVNSKQSNRVNWITRPEFAMASLVDNTSQVLSPNVHPDTLHEESHELRISSQNPRDKEQHPMTPFGGWTRISGMVVLLAQLCGAAFPQEQGKQDLGSNLQFPRTSQTKAGAGSKGSAAANPGTADGEGNLQKLGRDRRPLYRLNRSDVVALSFTLSPEFDQTLTIQPDGYITLKDAGTVFSQGLTLEEFRVAVLRAYTGYLHDPQVAVALKEFEHPYFVAGGEVGRPGKYELRADTSVLEAVEIAGGFTHQAKHSQVLLFRRANNDLVEAHLFNLKKMLKDRSLGELPFLRPGDLVFVPQNSISKIEPFLTKPALSMYVSPTQF
jgi:polysaccharide export outer membrane protein